VHPISGRESNHNGVDLIRKDGKPNEPILAPEAGKILTARKSNHPTGGYGYYVKMQGKSGAVHLMAHMVKNSLKVKKGDVVEQGDVLGLMGTTGNSTGVHLHWEVRVKGKFVDPIKWISNNGEPELPNNFHAWTKRKKDNTASAHIKNAPKGSKVVVRHNGVTVFLKTVRLKRHAGLGTTISLENGKNTIEILVDGFVVKRVSYNKTNSGGTTTSPENKKPVRKDPTPSNKQDYQPATPQYRHDKMEKEGQLPKPKVRNKPDITYIVKHGDTLTKIAKEHGSTVPKIKKHNKIENANLIRIGQVLKIPQE
jgi:LysM repeat protein